MSNQFIPLVDLKVQYVSLKPQLEEAVGAVMDRGDFILGRNVGLFEQQFAEFVEVDYAVGCGSGTDAIVLALRALEIGAGDEVIVPAMTFIATALAVTLTGARPVLVDVDAETTLIDESKIEEAITTKTKAIIPVHLYGQCADLDAILDIANKHGLAVIEDAAQAHGARDEKGRRAGSIGDFGCFSFYPGKNLGAYGDGGIVVGNDEQKVEKLKLIRNLGSTRKYHHEVIGLNSRLDTMQAAILRVKLPHLEGWNERRRKMAALYDDALSGLEGITMTRYRGTPAYHLYVIRVDKRDKVLKTLNDAGIGASIHYPFALHELKAYSDLGYKQGDFPVAEDWAHRCLSLPMYAELPADGPPRAAAILSQIS